MKRKQFIWTAGILVLLIIGFQVGHRRDKGVIEPLTKRPEPEKPANTGLKMNSADLVGLMSERKRRVKGLARNDSPNLFAEYQRDIRTRHGQSIPAYSPNYQVRELLKARSLPSTKALSKITSSNPLNWVERGPGNVSGRTRALLVDPDDPNFDTWYAGSVGGGVWKTTNAGQSWTDLTSSLPNLATSALAMASSNPDVIYAGTGEGFFNIDQIDGSGIWKTMDRGQTWEQLSATANSAEFQNVMRIIVDPSNHSILLAATSPGIHYSSSTRPSSGIFRSTNGGASWARVYDSGSNSVQQIVAAPNDFNKQYATVNGIGVVKSIDGGQTWRDASKGIIGVGRLELAISPVNPSKLYVSAEGGGSGSILYVSADAGENWIGGRNMTGSNVNWLGGQGWYDNTIAAHPYQEDFVFVGGINLWRIDVSAEIDTAGPTVTGIDFENTSSFLDLVDFGGQLAGGGIDIGSAPTSEFVSIEVRFGPGKSQKAHRFTVPAGSTSGVPASQYTFQDYVDVPFELWDIDNNRQLMLSFRDQTTNGQWELGEFNTNRTREYVYLHSETYQTSPSSQIGRNGGHEVKQLYFIWPVLRDGAAWNPGNLPASVVRIAWGSTLTKRIAISNVTDGYGQFGGSPKGVHVDHHNIVLIPTDPSTGAYRILNANDGGVSYSDNGGATFSQPLNGYNTTQFYGVDKKNGANEYIGGMQDNSTWRSPAGQSANASSKWTRQFGGDGFECVWHYTEPSKMLASLQFNGIFRSLNGGSTWSGVTTSNGLTDTGGRAPFFTRLAKSKHDPDIVFASGSSGLWRSDNFASSWELIEMPESWRGTQNSSEVKVSLAHPQVVWAGQAMLQDRPLFVSTDGGVTFSETSVLTGVTLGRITGLETHPTDERTAYALFSFAGAPKILRTTDLGQTWVDISGFGSGTPSSNGFPDVAVYSLLVMPYNTEKIWAGTEIGIFESNDGGGSWVYADNGLPATLVYEIVVVNDQVVVATHGRGVWSVTLPELAGYQPPVVAFSPRLEEVSGGGAGNIETRFTLRSAYDSTFVVVDDEKIVRLGQTVQGTFEAKFAYQAEDLDTVSVSIAGYKSGRQLVSTSKRVEVFALLAAQVSYSNDFDEATGDFHSSGFNVLRTPGFATPAVHSPHLYGNNSELIFTLKVPIVVATEGALLTYEDIAILEPGDPGSVFGDTNFWDYIVLEGSNDNGGTWVPLADGYDARFDQAWLTAFTNQGFGSASMFRKHSVDLLDTFSPGAQVLVRFRMFTDDNETGWGWVMDNLVIQDGVTSVAAADPIPGEFSLSQNYPNPFNPATEITYTLPQSEEVSLRIFNALGQEVKNLVHEQVQAPGVYKVRWDGHDDRGRPVASGIYLYRISAGDHIESRKMTLIK